MKPGIQTSEFWSTVIGSIIVAGGSSLGLDLDPSSVASIAAMVITYGLGRVKHKGNSGNNNG